MCLIFPFSISVQVAQLLTLMIQGRRARCWGHRYLRSFKIPPSHQRSPRSTNLVVCKDTNQYNYFRLIFRALAVWEECCFELRTRYARAQPPAPQCSPTRTMSPHCGGCLIIFGFHFAPTCACRDRICTRIYSKVLWSDASCLF